MSAGPSALLGAAGESDDVAARLLVIERDLDNTAKRLAAQRDVAQAAASARGGRTDGEAWAKAEVERTALDRLGNEVGDIRVRLETIAGTLAEASARGVDIAARLAVTGRLIARAAALQADYDRSTAALR